MRSLVERISSAEHSALVSSRSVAGAAVRVSHPVPSVPVILSSPEIPASEGNEGDEQKWDAQQPFITTEQLLSVGVVIVVMSSMIISWLRSLELSALRHWSRICCWLCRCGFCRISKGYKSSHNDPGCKQHGLHVALIELTIGPFSGERKLALEFYCRVGTTKKFTERSLEQNPKNF